MNAIDSQVAQVVAVVPPPIPPRASVALHSRVRFQLHMPLLRCDPTTLAVCSVLMTMPLIALRAQAAADRSSQAPLPISLQAVMDSVRLRSPLLDAARARARVARGARTTAGALENPMLMYQLENVPFQRGGRLAMGMMPEYMTSASLPLAPLYQRGARVAQADASVRAADADTRVAAQRIALDAARAFYRAALAAVVTDAADNVVLWLDSVVTYNRNRVTQGVTAESDLIRSELERDRATADAGLQSAELARARADLSIYLGGSAASAAWQLILDDAPLMFKSGATTAGVDSATSMRMAGTNADSALAATGRSRRPDLLAARERVAAAAAGASIEQRMRLSDLNAMFGVKRSGGGNTMLAGVSVPLPILNRNGGGVQSASAARDAAAFDLLATERAAAADLRGAEEAARILTERATSLARRDSATSDAAYLRRADQARSIALGAYREGAVPLLQVLDAARAWGEARVAYFRTLYAQHEAVLALVAARGGDVTTAPLTLMPLSSGRTPR